MALTNATTFDVISNTSTITFYNPGQVDQITYSANTVTFQSETTYNLSKSDLLLFMKYIFSFHAQLLLNFPSVALSASRAWPLCVFDITISSAGVTHLYYNQTTSGTTVLNIDYVPIAVSGAIATRAAPVTITMQEWFQAINMLQQYNNQVSIN